MDALGAYGSSSESSSSDEEGPSHGPLCKCPTCADLLKRFCIAKLATAGTLFRCKLCSKTFTKKAEGHRHIQVMHSEALQMFKKSKEPSLFAKKTQAEKDYEAKLDMFKVGSVLSCLSETKKRDAAALDERDLNAGPSGPVLTEAHTEKLLKREELEEAQAYDMEKRIATRMWECFIETNVFVVASREIKCLLCMEMFEHSDDCREHIKTHKKEYAREVEQWERFKRRVSQAPTQLGDYACLVCSSRFIKPQSLQRHWGDQIWLRNTGNHIQEWEEQKARWATQEEEECMGDGRVNNMGSYDMIKQFNAGQGGGGDDDDDGGRGPPAAKRSKGTKQFIDEF